MEAPNPASHQIFVSYSRQDADWAGAFVDALRKRGWSVFLDTRAIKAGDEWSEEIDAAIDSAKVVITLWSARSVKSSYVIAEVSRAVVRGTLIPLSIDRTRAPPAFRRFQTQPMLLEGARTLPPDLVATIEMRLAAPPAPPSAEERRLREELARTAALARVRGVPLLALQTLLERLGEADVAPDAIPARLESFVSEFLKLKADLARSTNADSDVAMAQSQALDLMDAGDLDGARLLISDALTRRRELHQQSARETAMLLAERGRIDVMQVRYPSAIAAYEEATAAVEGFDDEAARGYLYLLVAALLGQGDVLGDKAALDRAIVVIETRALPLTSPDRDPVEWGQFQGQLGVALHLIGERESITHNLDQAVAAHQAALKVLTRGLAPRAWAKAQNNLGIALTALGKREGSAKRLRSAAVAFRSALEEHTQDHFPVDWAMIRNNLGKALQEIGERESATAPIEEAVAAHRDAAEVYFRHGNLLQWALTQNDLGDTLHALARLDSETDTARLKEAVSAYRAALEEFRRDRAPEYRAKIHLKLGDVLVGLGIREGGTARLEEAVTAYLTAQETYTREWFPVVWKQNRKNLNRAQSLLARRSSKPWWARLRSWLWWR